MSNQTGNMKNGFQIPKWAGKPPNGLHLDVMKESKMIQKLMIDETKCYFFGRNKDQCEFVIDHGSCSRVHAVLLWHKHLNRSFLIDLGSTHGTFIGSIRLDPNKPQQVFVDSELKFGASTRTYIIRERPQLNKHFPSSMLQSANNSLNESKEDDSINMSNIAALPESEAELDNLTEFNTAHNKRIAQLVDITTNNQVLIKKKKKIVSFNEEEDVINPEDIDPSVGRFRNMIQTTIVIPNKKKRLNQIQQIQEIKKPKLNDKTEESSDQSDDEQNESQTLYDNDEFEPTIRSNLGIKILDLAPNVDNYQSSTITSEQLIHKHQQDQIDQYNREQQMQNVQLSPDSHRKKIYAKEAWPGRKSQVPLQPDLAQKPVQTTPNKVVIPVKTQSPNTEAAFAPNAQIAPKRLII